MQLSSSTHRRDEHSTVLMSVLTRSVLMWGSQQKAEEDTLATALLPWLTAFSSWRRLSRWPRSRMAQGESAARRYLHTAPRLSTRGRGGCQLASGFSFVFCTGSLGRIPAGCLYPYRLLGLTSLSESVGGYQQHPRCLSRLMACKHSGIRRAPGAHPVSS